MNASPAPSEQLEKNGFAEAPTAEEGVDVPSSITEKALLRKLDLHLLPAVTILYLLSFLDRSNVANAKLDGLTTDLNMTGNQYLTGLTLYFIGYVLFEVPQNIALKRTSPKLWLPSITLVWGIVATLMGVTQNMAGFFVVRFVLGVTEGGLFPGVVFYLSMWYVTVSVDHTNHASLPSSPGTNATNSIIESLYSSVQQQSRAHSVEYSPM